MGRPIQVLAAVVVPLVAAVGAALWIAFDDSGDGPDDAGRPTVTPGDPGVAAPGTASTKRVGAPAKLSGEVRRASDGKPVAAQRVVIEGVRPKALVASTDARGAFEFPDVPHGGPYDVVVAASDCAEVKVPGIELKRGEVRDVGTLWLAPAVPVIVDVRTFAGDPIAGAAVEAFAVRPNSPGFDAPAPPSPVATMTTGADGLARFSGLAVGTWTFVAGKPGFARRGSSEERLESGESERRIQIALEHGWRIEGRVLTRAGTTIPGASVVALRRTLDASPATAPLCSRTKSDPEGRYALDSLPGADVCVWAARPGGRLAIVAAVRPPGVPRLDLVLPDPSFVTGHVTDRSGGAPIAGAALTASFEILGGVQIACDATTDETGAYRMTLPMRGSLSSIEAVKEGYVRGSDDALARANLEIPEGVTIVRDVALDRGSGLTGVVRGPDGAVAGATVTAFLRDFQQAATTDREGRYRFDALPRGTAVVAAYHVGFEQKEFPENVQSALSDGSAPKRYVVEIPTEGATTLDLTLDVGGHVFRGIVTGAGGAPLEGARVGVTGDDSRPPISTGKDGAFRIDRLVEGRGVDVWVRKDGFAAYSGSFDVPTEADAAAYDIALNPVRRVTGTIRSATGARLVDAFVQIGGGDSSPTAEDEWSWLAETRRPVRADGSFEIEVSYVRDSFRVRAKAAGLAPSVSAPVQFDAGGATPAVELVLEAAHSLAGVVRTPRGEPVAGAWVAIFPRSGANDTSQESNGAWGPAVVAVADAAGRFTADDLASGWWGVRAWGTSTLHGRVVVEVPRESHVEVQVESALTIDGTLVVEGGGAVAGASLVATGPNDEEHQALSDATGAFRFAGLASGAYSIRVAPSSTGRANFVPTTKADVAAGTLGLRIELPLGLTIAGLVVEGDGRPARGATIDARDESSGEEFGVPSGFSDADGRFEIVGLRAGRVALTVVVRSDDDELRLAYGGVAVGARDLRIALPKTAFVEGVLVDESGAPLATTIRAVAEAVGQAAGRDMTVRNVDSNEEGHFSFRGPETTSYRLQLQGHPSLGLVDVPPVRPGGPVLRLVAKSGASIAGAVVDAEGKPVAGVRVCASFDDCFRQSTTRADGAFEIRGLAPGATCSVYLQSDRVIQVPPQSVSAGRRDVKIVVELGLEVSGRLVDQSGEGVPNYRIHLWTTDGTMQRSARTQEDGRFTVRGLSPGEWQAKATPLYVYNSADAEPRPCGTVRAGDRDVTLRLDIVVARPGGR